MTPLPWRRRPRQPRDLTTGGREARVQAEAALVKAQARRDEVEQLAAVTRRRLQLNGFTNDIEIAIGRRP